MNFKGKLKRIVEQWTNTQIHISRVLPHGFNVFRDIANYFPKYRADTVFDVGANSGQSAKGIFFYLPYAYIYCFEPVNTIFHQLQDNLKNNDRVYCFHLALSSFCGKGTMVLQSKSVTSFLLGQSKKLTATMVQKLNM